MAAGLYVLEADGQQFEVQGSSEEEAIASLTRHLQQKQASPNQAIPPTQKAGAELSHDERLAKIAALDAEMESVRSESTLGDAVTEIGGRTAINLLQGTALAVNEIGEAATDLLGADRAAEFFQQNAEDISGGAAIINEKLVESTVGRQLTAEERADIKTTSDQAGGRAKLASTIALGLGGGGFAFGANSVKAGIAIGSAEGAITTAILSQSDSATIDERRAERLGQMKVGAVLGGVFGFVPGVISGVKNLLSKHIDDVSEGAEQGFKLADDFGMDITYSQASGSPVVANLEQAAAGQEAQKLLRQQADEIAERIGNRLGVKVPHLDDVGEGIAAQLAVAQQTFRTASATMRQTRNVAWRETMKLADDVSAGAGIMRPKTLLAEIDAVADDLLRSTQGKLGLAKPAQAMRAEVAAAANGGGATAGQLQRWQTQMNDWMATSRGMIDDADGLVAGGQYDSLSQVMTGKLRTAFKNGINDIDTAAMPTVNREALRLTKQGMADYSAATGTLRAMENDMAVAMGLQGGTAAETMVRLGKADPAVVRNAFQAMEDANVPGVQLMKDQLAETMLHASTQVGMNAALKTGAKVGDLNVAAFAEAFGSNTRRSLLAGVISPQKEQIAREGLKLARTLLNAGEQGAGVVKTTQAVGLQEMAINAFSLNPGFVARLVAGAVSRGKSADWLFFHPEGIRTLRSMGSTAIKTPKTNAIRNVGTIALLGAAAPEGESDREKLGE